MKTVESTIGELRSFSQRHLPVFLADNENETPCPLLAILVQDDRCIFIGEAEAEALSLSEAINSLLSLPTDWEVWLTLPHLAHPKPLGMVTRQYVERDESHFALLYTRD